MQGLSDTSFLTSLDMDPTQSLTSPPHSGFSSPVPGIQNNLNVGGNSRASTPSGIRSVDGKEALQRMANRLGMASRLFTGGN